MGGGKEKFVNGGVGEGIPAARAKNRTYHYGSIRWLQSPVSSRWQALINVPIMPETDKRSPAHPTTLPGTAAHSLLNQPRRRPTWLKGLPRRRHGLYAFMLWKTSRWCARSVNPRRGTVLKAWRCFQAKECGLSMKWTEKKQGERLQLILGSSRSRLWVSGL